MTCTLFREIYDHIFDNFVKVLRKAMNHSVFIRKIQDSVIRLSTLENVIISPASCKVV